MILRALKSLNRPEVESDYLHETKNWMLFHLRQNLIRPDYHRLYLSELHQDSPFISFYNRRNTRNEQNIDSRINFPFTPGVSWSHTRS